MPSFSISAHTRSYTTILCDLAEHRGDDVAFRFLRSGEDVAESLTYRELDQRARLIAAQLRTESEIGARALLLYPAGLEFVVAFFGCLYAGVVAVPTSLPQGRRKLERVRNILRDAEAAWILTTAKLLPGLQGDDFQEQEPRLLATDELRGETRFEPLVLEPQELAFLQYTSGSTGTPKGVEVTHANLISNGLDMDKGSRHDQHSVMVTWLPTFHDMGLIYGVLQPIFNGFPCIMMAPEAFMQRPLRWLQAIDRFGGTHTAAPNFAFDLCVRRVSQQEAAALDLSSWRSAINGAEPINPASMRRFNEHFSLSGLGHKVLCPGYGLAEGTLKASSDTPDRTFQTLWLDREALKQQRVIPLSAGDPQGIELVDCGGNCVGTRVEIVDPETCAPVPQQDGMSQAIGEIWLAGPSIARGYWQREAETEEVFHARLSNHGSTRFLRTGDYGFLNQGRLYVTGRLKDMIIIRGANYYPQDIEVSITAVSDKLIPGGCAAFSVNLDGEERLVVVAEVMRTAVRKLVAQPLCEAIAREVLEQHDIQPWTVVLLKPNGLAKTSSGKVQRRACRDAFLANELREIARLVKEPDFAETLDQDSGEALAAILKAAPQQGLKLLEQFIRQQIAAFAGVSEDEVENGKRPAALGLDSLKLMELEFRLEQNLAIRLPVNTCLAQGDLMGLAALVLPLLHADTSQQAVTPGTEVGVPLSPNQQALWYLQKLSKQSTAYSIPFALDLPTTLDKQAMARAFAALVTRYPVLRTRFVGEADVLQVEGRADFYEYEEIDGRHWDEDELARELTTAANRPFDLERDPVLRVRLYDRGQRGHVLFINLHHIITDFWSIAIMLDELGKFYAAASCGLELDPGVGEFTRQQPTVSNEASEVYWHKQLGDGPFVLDLPCDFERPAVQSFAGASLGFRLDEALSAGLKALARQHQVTLHTLLMAAYQVLLYRWSDQESLLVGTPTAGRHHHDQGELLGYFVNPVVVRGDLSGEPDFATILRRTDQTMMAALDHPYPFPTLVDRLLPQRDASRSALFQTMFVFQQPPRLQGLAPFSLMNAGARLNLHGLEIVSHPLPKQHTQFDLTLAMLEDGPCLAGTWEYASKLFLGETISRLSDCFENLLRSLVATPELAITRLDLRQDQPSVSRDFAEAVPTHTVLDMFATRVRECPADIASETVWLDQNGDWQKQVWSFEQIDHKANAIAKRLLDLGLRPEEPVGVLMKRASETVAAMLAIFKAGGMYVPLDVAAPLKRLEAMMADAGIQRYLVQGDLADDFRELTACAEVVTSDHESADTCSLPLPTVNQAAYMIFTSGSTGKPKGVVVSHSNLASYLNEIRRCYGHRASDRVLPMLKLPFDASMEDCFPVLLNGGTLVHTHEEAIKDLAYLNRFQREQGITVANFSHSLWAAWVADLRQRRVKPSPTLRLVSCGGEAMLPGRVKDWHQLNTAIPLMNVYGPTETTVVATFHKVDPQRDRLAARIPIGKPLVTGSVRVLDQRLTPVALGMRGGLYIGGARVSRGYWQRAALTAERFVPDPFSTQPGARLYHSGDLVRVNGAGDLVFLGRSDQQVKIRGFRIEPSEIESLLATREDIQNAAVVLKKNAVGRQAVAVFVQPSPEAKIDAPLLQAWLQERLPDYMVPSEYAFLTALPLMVSGKINRKALTAMPTDSVSLDFAAAETETEQVICEVWSELLKLPRVGRHDNFFGLGGDSILSIQAITRLGYRGVRLDTRQFLQHQTPARLALVANENKVEVAAPQVDGRLPLLPMQHWFFEQAFPKAGHFNQSLLLRVADLDPGAMEAALNLLVDRHEVLRSRFEVNDSLVQHRIANKDDRINLETAPIDQLADISQTAQASLDLERGPLLRAIYFEPNRLLLIIHHLVIDAVSWHILLEELAELYQAQRKGEALALSPASSASQWVQRLQAFAQSEDCKQEVAFWRQQLPRTAGEGLGACLEVKEPSPRTITLTLDPARTQDLLGPCLAPYRSRVDELLITALLLALPVDEASLALESHGREVEDMDLSRCLGWFTAAFPLRFQKPAGDDLGALIETVKETRRRVPNQGTGYGLLRYLSEDAAIRDSLAGTPAILFNYLGRLDASVDREPFLGLASEAYGSDRADDNQSQHRLELNAWVANQQLEIHWRYDASEDQTAMAALYEGFQQALSDLSTYCLQAPERLTPADFPLLSPSRAQLDEVMADDVVDLVPLTPLQTGLLLVDRMSTGDRSYLEFSALELRGPLRAEAFKKAWEQLSERHAILRSAFVPMGECYCRRGHQSSALAWTEADWSEINADGLASALNDLVTQERARGIDVAAPPLMRQHLLRLADDRHILVSGFHHVILDGWSFGVLIGEVFSLYRELLGEGRAELAPAPRYEDYLALVQNADQQQALAYWRDRFAGVEGLTALPFAGGERKDSGIIYHDHQLDGDLVKGLAAEYGLTPAVLMQMAWAKLLADFSGSDQVTFGVTVSGRSHQVFGIERMVGLLINTLPMTVRHESSLLLQQLQQLQQDLVDMERHGHLALAEIQKVAGFPGQSLFDSLLVFENYPFDTSLHLADGLSLGEIRSYDRTHYPLTVLMQLQQELKLRFIYDRQRFDEAEVIILAEHLEHVFSTMVATLAGRELGELSSKHRQCLLHQWQGSVAETTSGNLVTLILDAAQQASRPALQMGDQSWSYPELLEGVGRWAALLRSRGVTPEQAIGVSMSRSPEAVMAFLAILAVGAVYVPLDPSYPQDRLSYMMEDARIGMVITDQTAADNQSILTVAETPPGQAAYLLYTSGSTGRPKGVVMTHEAMVPLIRQQVKRSGSFAQVTLQFAPFGFDVSIQETLATLAAGGTLVLIPESHRRDFKLLRDDLARYKVRRLFLPYVALNHLARDPGDQTLPDLKELVCAGETLVNHEAVRRFRAGRVLENQYGPTETHVATAYALPDQEQRDLPPIGEPVAGRRVYLLNKDLRLLPPGGTGRLFIGGTGVARGYHGRPALTAARFLPDPLAEQAGGRMYDSGDLARWDLTGQLHFLGRDDHQVKIRGYRVELGEIEAALEAHPSVSAAAVVARRSQDNQTFVVAYFCGGEEATPAERELREFMKQSLPDYMVPARFVKLTEMPMTPSGKVNRRLLPEPEAAVGSDRGELDPVQSLVIRVWRDVLGATHIGLDDAFLSVGGHSLSAMRVAARLEESFRVEIPLRVFFEGGTPRIVADLIRGREPGSKGLLQPREKQDLVPLSKQQQRLFFLQRFAPDRGVYNMPGVVRLVGDLDRESFQRAFHSLIQRHEILRTTYEMVDGEARQRIRQVDIWKLNVKDLSHLDPAEREQALARLIAHAAAEPFDLEWNMSIRVSLVRLDERTHILLLTLHHIAADGWSIANLLDELKTLYAAYVSGEADPLPPVSFQYGDYACFQAEQNLDERSLVYWQQQLTGVQGLALPCDFTRPELQSFHGASYGFTLSPELSNGVETLSQSQSVTPFMALLSFYQLLLFRFSGQADFAVGSPVAGRHHSELEDMVGLFIQTLVLRARLRHDDSLSGLLQQTRQTLLTGMRHDDLPFEQLEETLELERDTARPPLFQVLFSMQNQPAAKFELAGLSCEPLPPAVNNVKFDLVLNVALNDGCYQLNLDYNTDLFRPQTIEGLAQDLCDLIAKGCSSPDTTLTDLAFSDRQPGIHGETHALSLPWCLHKCFEATLAEFAERDALLWEAGSLDYGSLNRRANGLALRLREQGIGPECIVGVCFQRSPEMMIALLGILKAGAAYLPLDPALPQQRMAHIIEQSGCGLILGHQPPTGYQGPFLSVSDEQAEQAPVTPDWPDAAAYVLFTSGSTGRPKGIVVSHGALVSHMRWMARAFPLNRDDRLLQKTPISFDASVWELFAPLLEGATLVLPSHDVHRQPAEMIRAIRKHRVTRLQLVPAQLKLLLARSEFGECHSLRDLFCGGEALDHELVESTGRLLDIPVHNLYGPTETTIQVVAHDGSLETTGKIPIGEAIDRVKLYVTTQDMLLVPEGELLIGGESVSRGYVGQASLTAASFVPDPFSQEPGQRLFKSGDLVRQRADRKLEFVGRRDDQVKLFGQRIELSEIEQQLERAPEVCRAAVVVHGSGTHRELAAYVEGTASAQSLRKYLGQHLPDYMVPTRWTILENLPTTSSGKLDRKALPEPAESSRRDLTQPRNAAETAMLELWQEVLGLERIGIHESFFDLGGQSIKAMMLVGRIQTVFGRELPLKLLFANPTVASLCASLDSQKQRQLPAIVARAEESAPLSYAQERLWFLDQLEGAHTAYSMPVALRFKGELEEERLKQACVRLLARHENLRSRFSDVDGRVMAAFVPAGSVDFETIETEDLQAALRSELQTPFELAKGPLIRFRLYRPGGNEWVFLINMHHIIVDGWSSSLLLDELLAHYEGHQTQQPDGLQYGDFAKWQRQPAVTQHFEYQLNYWEQQLAGTPELLELPYDYPRPSTQSFAGAYHHFQLSSELTSSLQQLARRWDTTPFVLMTAAFMTLIHRHTGAEDIPIGVPVAGRVEPEVAKMLGLFLNTIVLRGRPEGSTSFFDFVKALKLQTLAGFAHGDVPIEKVIERLAPKRSLDHSPLFQVMVIYQNVPRPALTLPGLDVAWEPLEPETSKFDLTLYIEELEGCFRASLEYNRELFKAETMVRWQGHLENLLTGLVANPDTPLDRLPLLDESEQARVIDDCVSEQTLLPVHLGIERQAAATPDATAVIFADTRLTYAALNREANGLAHELMGRGVGYESRVGLFMERSEGLPVALLGILKSGAAYVPLDPDYPQARIEYVLDHAGVECIVCDAASKDLLPEAYQSKLLVLGTYKPRSLANPALPCADQSLAYVIYTSGSTGLPKGVQLSHGNLCL